MEVEDPLFVEDSSTPGGFFFPLPCDVFVRVQRGGIWGADVVAAREVWKEMPATSGSFECMFRDRRFARAVLGTPPTEAQ